ncbi:MAG TPA: DUF2059 domain-containing protein [Thermoanaerobaculia bacterium]|nr:DUF2059 domain-containing protein [Thermoanaerobaculia bacterium]
MKGLRRSIGAGLFVLLLAASASAAAAPAAGPRDQKVRELLRLTGAAQMSLQMLDGMIAQMRTALPNVKPEFWTRFRQSVDTEELVGIMVPIYEKYLTPSDVDQLIGFYSSPVGRKLISVQPGMVKEGMEAGQIWGRGLAEKAMKEIDAEKKKQKP